MLASTTVVAVPTSPLEDNRTIRGLIERIRAEWAESLDRLSDAREAAIRRIETTGMED